MKDKMYMNPKTGSVDTLENWQEDYKAANDGDKGECFLVPVIKDKDGSWIEDEEESNIDLNK